MIAELLPQGEENAITTADLLRLVGVASARDLQRRVEAERLHGALILSTGRGGYFMPSEGEKGQHELSAYVHTTRARALNTLRMLKPATRAMRFTRQAGQPSLVLDQEEVCRGV